MLILGSLPGEASLAVGRYYAHPRNRFWHLAGAVTGREGLPTLEYDQRLQILREAGVGLWDTIASAERAGSLDAAIRDHAPAPLAALARSLPLLRAVGFNGATAARIGRRALAGQPFVLIDLPSSSHAFAAMSLADKAAKWRALGGFLEGDRSPAACAPTTRGP